MYVPKDSEIRREILKLYHNTPAAGHPGRAKTLELVSRNDWWPHMAKWVHDYVDGCDRCKATKIFPSKPAGPLQPNAVPEGPWQSITCDLIVDLPKSEGFDSIFVVIDQFSKQAHFILTTKNVDSKGIVDLFLKNVWKLHGTPKQVISDRGTQFVSKFMKQLSKRLGIKWSASTAYHPRTDGQTERVNQEVELLQSYFLFPFFSFFLLYRRPMRLLFLVFFFIMVYLDIFQLIQDQRPDSAIAAFLLLVFYVVQFLPRGWPT